MIESYMGDWPGQWSLMSEHPVQTQTMTETDRLSTPSRITETEPALPRLIGFMGTVIVLSMILLALWVRVLNRPLPLGLSISWNFIKVWTLIGIGLLVMQAILDRTRTTRRNFALMGSGLLTLGLLIFGFAFVCDLLTQGKEPSDPLSSGAIIIGLSVVSVLGLLQFFAFIGPFVQATQNNDAVDDPMSFLVVPGWLRQIRKSQDLMRLSIGLLCVLAALVTLSVLLYQPLKTTLLNVDKMNQASLVPYGFGPLAVTFMLSGLLFLLIYSQSEDEIAWVQAGVRLLSLNGLILAMASMLLGFVDLLGFPDWVTPYGLIYALLGFVFCWGYFTRQARDSHASYRLGWILVFLGSVTVVLALARSLYPIWVEYKSGQFMPSYLSHNGFLLICIGVCFALLGLTRISDNKIVIITCRELGTYFTSPIAYLVVAGIAVVAWFQLLMWLPTLEASALEFRRAVVVPEPVVVGFTWGFFPIIGLLAVIPMLTMRLLSEEKRTGTLEVLLTAPVDETAVVLGKFFSAWIIFILAWSIWFIFPLVVRIMGGESFDYRPLLSFALGVNIMAGAFIAFGLFCSSLTNNQITSFLLCLAGMFSLLLPYFLAPDRPGSSEASSSWIEFMQYISFVDHYRNFVVGTVHVKTVLYYLSMAVFWNFLTVKVLEARRWK